MNRPIISVVIPVYNVEAYIETLCKQRAESNGRKYRNHID